MELVYVVLGTILLYFYLESCNSDKISLVFQTIRASANYLGSAVLSIELLLFFQMIFFFHFFSSDLMITSRVKDN